MNNAIRGSKGNRRMVRSTSVVMSTANTTESRMNHPMKRFQISQMTGTVKTWLFRSRRLGAVAASFFLIVAGSALVIAQPASASTPPSWSAPTQIDGGRVFYAVSCTSTTFCMAVDANGYALSYNGSTWSTPTQIDPAGGTLAAVSCTSSTFCMAVDYDGNAMSYNGSTWSSPTLIDGDSGVLDGVSCTSTTFCMAVDFAGRAMSYDGLGWTSPTQIDTGGPFTAVSCTSTTFCMAVAGDDSAPSSGDAVVYDGSGWSTNLTALNAALYYVSCTSPSFCMAVGYNDGNAISYNGSTWSTTTPTDSASQGWDAVSCTSTTFCMAADSAGNAEFYGGSVWSAPTLVDGGTSYGNLDGVSCTSPSFCMAVDANGNALIYSTIAATLTLSGTPVTSTSGNAYTVSLEVPTGDSSPTGSVTITDSATGTCSTTPTWSGTIGSDSPAGYDTYTDGCSIATPESAGETVSAVYHGADYTVATSSPLDIATAPVAPSPVAQAALTLTSTSGTVGTALTLTSSGGSGTGAVTYAVTSVGTAVCSITGGTLNATSAGTCTVTVSKAADSTDLVASSSATTVTFVAAGVPVTVVPVTVVPVTLHTTGVHGSAVVGKTVTVTITGAGFYGQPKITSNEAGTKAVVSHDSGKLLTVRVTVKAGSRTGEHTFTIRLANGKSCRVNYLVK